MTDRERLLMTVASAVTPGTRTNIDKPYSLGSGPFWDSRVELAAPGDIVWARTSGWGIPHTWTIARMVEHLPNNGMLVRELGGKRECSISNEHFYVLRGVQPYLLLEGKEWKLYNQIRRAFRLFHRGDWHPFRCALHSVRFEEGAAVVRVRERLSCDENRFFEVKFETRGRIPSMRKIAERIWAECPWP